ncbi:MAG: GAF domain-containing protein [Lachnospiraceae bacterium]|nr:GAF domain-containing protein [Lachnospiraceae bacterium]
MTTEKLQKILEIGIALSEEKDYNRLLEQILSDVMWLTNCDAGTLYLKTGDYLNFKIMRNDTMKTYQGGDGEAVDLPPVPISSGTVSGLAALTEQTICIDDVWNCREYDLSGPIQYDKITHYHSQSMLVVPMKNRRGEISGVLQLINAQNEAKETIPFAKDCVRLVESVASQAAVAIQNMEYLTAIKGLFHSFVQVMSTAIDERTPYNATHTRNMVRYGERFVDYLNQKQTDAGEEVLFGPERKEEFLMSVWFHDIGKLVTPLEIMNKAARLTPQEMKDIQYRFETMRLRLKIQLLEQKLSEEDYSTGIARMEEGEKLIFRANEAGFLPDETLAEIERLAEYTCPENPKKHWLTEDELHRLQIRKGTLTGEERQIMEEHVKITRKLLSEIEFPKQYEHVIRWASSHHEYINGTGYPEHISGEAVPYEVRILTILDIYDALTADDRPYKPGMPAEKALSILQAMAEKEGKLDIALTRQFIESRSWDNAKEA